MCKTADSDTLAQSETREHGRLHSTAMTQLDLGFHRITLATGRNKNSRGSRAQPGDVSKLLQKSSKNWWPAVWYTVLVGKW